jgi:hypothetical protein
MEGILRWGIRASVPSLGALEGEHECARRVDWDAMARDTKDARVDQTAVERKPRRRP